MLDSAKEFGKQDQDIIRRIIAKGKGMVIVVNTWDLISKKTETTNEYLDNIT